MNYEILAWGATFNSYLIWNDIPIEVLPVNITKMLFIFTGRIYIYVIFTGRTLE